MTIRRCLALALALFAAGIVNGRAAPADLPVQQNPNLIPMYHSDRIWNGVATTRDGRVFVGFPQADQPGVQIEELAEDGTATPFPDAAWNTPVKDGDISHAFVLVNSLRIGPDGALWVVDAGAPGLGHPAIKGAARLIRIDLAGNKVTRIYDLAQVADEHSYIDDVRFHGGLAYLTDAGTPGLIVLDLATGAARRVLDHDKSTTDQRPMYADGRLLMDKDGNPVRVHADQLEVSPDGQTLYFQPASGPMWRVGTKWLDDPAVAATDLAGHVEHFVDTPTTGGTAIDAQGNIYVSDENRRRILRITPAGDISTVVADPRLVWVDAMWIDDAGSLWMPAAQLNLIPGLNKGKAAVAYPVILYRMGIDAQPSPIDHP